jgi:hypothetical protein
MLACSLNKGANMRNNNRKEADILWASLQNNNERLRQELKRLAQHPDANPEGDFSDIRTLIQRTRQHIRTLTRRTGVPIKVAFGIGIGVLGQALKLLTQSLIVVLEASPENIIFAPLFSEHASISAH